MILLHLRIINILHPRFKQCLSRSAMPWRVRGCGGRSQALFPISLVRSYSSPWGSGHNRPYTSPFKRTVNDANSGLQVVTTKVKFSLCARHICKQWSEGTALFCICVIWRWQSALRPSHYEETAPVTHCVGGWEGPRADSLICRTGKLLPALAGNQTTIPRSTRPYFSHYYDYTIPASKGKDKMSCLC